MNALPEQDVTNEEKIVKPAVDGTINVLKACMHVGGVKRVVLTGSKLAMYSFGRDSDKV